MRQETRFRGLVDALVALGWVPWVLVCDTMKTVTSGRDAGGEAVRTPGLRQLAGECGFSPQACDPGAPNQQGSVEALVKWVKENLLPDRTCADDTDLAAQLADWLGYANGCPAAATGTPPQERLAAKVAQGGALPATPRDAALPVPGQVSPEALVAVDGNRGVSPGVPCRSPTSARRLWCGSTARGSASGATWPASRTARAHQLARGGAASTRPTAPRSSRTSRAPGRCSPASAC